MRYFLTIFLLIFLFSTNTQSQENSIVIDIDFLIKNSKKGKSLSKKISSIREKNSKKISKNRKKFKRKGKKINFKKNYIV